MGRFRPQPEWVESGHSLCHHFIVKREGPSADNLRSAARRCPRSKRRTRRLDGDRVSFRVLHRAVRRRAGARALSIPQVWVFETYRGGFGALSRTSASSLPAPPSKLPVFRPIITFGKSVFETLSPASETGDRWSYKRIDAAGSDKPVVTRGQCKLVMENVR